MGRIRRYIRRLFVTVAMLVAVGLAVLWVRSPTYDESISCGSLAGRCWSLSSAPHRVELSYLSGYAEQYRAELARLCVGSHPRVLKLTTGDMVFRYQPPAHSVLGFGWETRYPPTPGLWSAHVTVPYAALIVLFALPATVMLARSIRHGRRLRAGCCVACGYDLRASTARCPECGADTTPPTAVNS